jgi:hypothetical protein
VSPYPSALLSSLDLGDIVSCDVLDEVSEIRNLPATHEHSVQSEANALLQHEYLTLLCGPKVCRVAWALLFRYSDAVKACESRFA